MDDQEAGDVNHGLDWKELGGAADAAEGLSDFFGKKVVNRRRWVACCSFQFLDRRNRLSDTEGAKVNVVSKVPDAYDILHAFFVLEKATSMEDHEAVTEGDSKEVGGWVIGEENAELVGIVDEAGILFVEQINMRSAFGLEVGQRGGKADVEGTSVVVGRGHHCRKKQKT